MRVLRVRTAAALAAASLLAVPWAVPEALPPGAATAAAALGALFLLSPPSRPALAATALAHLGLWPLGWGGGPWAAGLAAWALWACPGGGAAPPNGLDRFFVAHDYPGMRVNSHLFLDLLSPPDRPALLRAVARLMEDLPVARSLVWEAPLGVMRAVTSRGTFRPEALVDWHGAEDERTEAEALDAPFRLARRPPFRLRVGPRPGGGWRLVMSVHHSAADGTGQWVLLERLLAGYAVAGPAAGGPPPQPRFRRLLAPRGGRWLLAMVRRHLRPMDKVGVRNASVLEREDARPGLTRHRQASLGPEAWEALRAAAHGRGSSRNDLVLASVLVASDAWRRARSLDDRPFRLLLPTDLRPLLGLGPSAGNYVGVVRAEFTPAEVRSPALPDLIRDRVREGRTLEEAVETPVNLGVLSAVLPPWLFRRALRRFDLDPRSFFFSLLVSTIRVPPGLAWPEGLAVERAWIRGSIQRQPGVGVVLTTDDRGAEVVFEYREGLSTEAGVEDLLRRFLAEVERWVRSAPGAQVAVQG